MSKPKKMRSVLAWANIFPSGHPAMVHHSACDAWVVYITEKKRYAKRMGGRIARVRITEVTGRKGR